MNYLDYNKLNVKGKLTEIISLQLKLKNILYSSNISVEDGYSINYLVSELKKKIRKLKNEIKRIR